MSTQNEKLVLLDLLDQSLQLVSGFSGGYSGEFLSAEEFYTVLADSIYKLKCGDLTQLDKIRIWFLPTSCWDDFTGEHGQILGNQIDSLLNRKFK